MALPGSSPRWREVEARLRPVPVRPVIQVIPEPVVVDLAERKRLQAERATAKLAAPIDTHSRWPAGKVILLVAQKHGMTVDAMLGPSRQRHFVYARHEACYELRRRTFVSLAKIAQHMRRGDHTTIWNAISRHIERTGAPLIDGCRTRPGRPGYTPMPYFWTPDKLAEGQAHLARGLTYKRAAKVMGVTKAALITALCKARRLASKNTPTD
jgi:hypothetical protein